MAAKNIVDAGVIVAYLTDEENHGWAETQFKRFPFFETCEAVISEACARLEFEGLNQFAVAQLLNRGVLKVNFSAASCSARILELMEKYRDLPMDFADACLVAMSEEQKDSVILTLDRDFKTYRRHGRGHIPILSP